MDIFDNTDTNRAKSCSAAFGINIDGVNISYTYIRKNACSSFKKLFLGESKSILDPNNVLSGMHKYHWQKNLDDIKGSDYRVFVYRDPFERCISLYKNKFIQRSGNVDIFESYQNITGCNPYLATFEDFVNLYLTNIKKYKLDAHAYPQFWHLYPVDYNAAVSLNSLNCDMKNIIGVELANKYFSKAVNSTKSIKTELMNKVNSISANDLRHILEFNSVTPSTESFRSQNVVSIIENIYSEDYKMISRISNGSPS